VKSLRASILSFRSPFTFGLSATLAVTLAGGAAHAQDPAPVEGAAPALPAAPAEGAPPAAAPVDASALEAKIEEANQRALIVERKLELLEEAAATAKTTTPVVVAGERGFNFKSADGAFVVKVRGIVHADARQYLDDDALEQSNTFLIRRARPTLEATFFDVADFKIMHDVAGSVASLLDAYVDLRPFPWLKLRAGKFKPPVGLERIQSASAIVFPERAFPTSLVPNRDVGFQLHGAIGPSILTYELGIFNGVVDGGSGDVDNNYAKDFAGRLFVQPLKSDPYSFFANLGFGIAGSIGGQRGRPATFTTSGTTVTRTATSTPGLPTFRTAGQQAFFSYLVNDNVPDATVVGRGRRTRLSPQLYWYYDAGGLLAEYVQSSQTVIKGANKATLTHRAWQAQASYVFGGKALFEGVSVTRPLSPKTGGLGALELAFRYNALDIDDDTYPTYANINSAAKKATGWSGAVNWHWSKAVKLSSAYEATIFEGGLSGGDRATEHVLFQRVQSSF
jgi:phosphate-selective porin OprO/OprP